MKGWEGTAYERLVEQGVAIPKNPNSAGELLSGIQAGYIDPIAKFGWPGIKPSTTNPKDLIGAKKLSMSVLPDVAVAHANHAMMDGARKYKAFNWRTKDVRATIYIEACRRHIAQWFDREETASDSGVHHLGHAIACLAILLDAQESGNLVDDRPDNAGGFTRTLGRLNEVIAKGT